MKQRYVVVDLETTGNSPKKGDSIIQFACVVIENESIVDEYSTYIKPEKPIPPFIQELTGISDKTVTDAPDFSEVAPIINSYLSGAIFVAHNVLFDLSFLQEELKTAGFEGFFGSTVDTVELAKILKPTADSYRLSQLSAEEGLFHERPHQADSDAYVTALLFLKLKSRLSELPKVTLKQLFRLSFSLKSEISELIGQCITEKDKKALEPLTDLEIYRGLALKLPQQKVRNLRPPSLQDYQYDHDAKFNDMKTALPQVEKRIGQLHMMNSVYDTFLQTNHRIIEAGTGIGKSLAYLLPAAYYSKNYSKKMIISTYTLHLQEQLLKKEIPALQKILSFPIDARTIKGKNNYLSLARFERVLRQKDDNYDTSLTKMQILVWLTQTETGDRDELHLTSGGAAFWDKLQTSLDLPAKLQMPWDAKDFYCRAKEAALNADILITNHSFLIHDVTQENFVLPLDSALILDEAHQLNKAFSTKLGFKISYLEVRTLINRLGLYNQKMMLFRLEKMLKEKNLEITISASAVEQFIHDFFYESEQLFYMISRQTEKSDLGGRHKQTIQYDCYAGQSREAAAIKMLAERVADFLKQIRTSIEERVDALAKDLDSLGKNHLYYLSEARDLITEVDQLETYLREFFLRNKKDSVYWAEVTKSGQHSSVMLFSQPVLAGDSIWRKFLSKFPAVVMTSATLSVNGSFKFFLDQLGIKGNDISTESYPSPFNYKKAVKLIIPSTMPEINAISLDEYSKELTRHIKAAAFGSKGRMLVLFTSRELLRMTYQKLKDEPALSDFTLLAQGITGGSKWKLLKSFQGFQKGILLGNSSFWDGVDVPGDKLSCLVIVRLPFSPPDEPVTAAMNKLLIQEGKNPFSAYSLPEAILRFRQGVGRLIRSENDKGILLVLDRRIQTSSYGQSFLEAIPSVSVSSTPIGDLGESIREWLD